MKKNHSIIDTMMKMAVRLTMERWDRQVVTLEKKSVDSFGNELGLIKSLPESPERLQGIIKYRDMVGVSPFFQEIKEAWKILPIFAGLVSGSKKSWKLFERNRDIHDDHPPATPSLWEEFEDKARFLGVTLTGYTTIPEELIFSGMGVIAENAVVLAMELEADPIARSPRFPSSVETIRVYRDLGRATNSLAGFLQERGYRAQPMHPYGGSVLFSLMALRAGLGVPGFHGLLITKMFGPRQRISIISTSADPLPPGDKNPIEDFRDFCKDCKRCIKKCPGRAFYDPPMEKENSPFITHMDLNKCYPFFSRFKGCSVCIKVCADALKDAGLAGNDS